MIMHLKRFELNFETFQHEKLNNRFDFPLVINLEPYTKEGLARRDAESKAKEVSLASDLEWVPCLMYCVVLDCRTRRSWCPPSTACTRASTTSSISWASLCTPVRFLLLSVCT